MKLGNVELDPLNTEIPGSTLEARMIFLRLFLVEGTPAVRDLLRLFNRPLLPDKISQDDGLLQATSFVCLVNLSDPEQVTKELKVPLDTEIVKTPLFEFFQYVSKNRRRLDMCLERSRKELGRYFGNPSDGLVTEKAFKKLIPDWATLMTRKGARALCESIRTWSRRWNLCDDWCLNFALNVLIEFKIEHYDRCVLPELRSQDQSACRFWEWQVDEWARRSWESAAFEMSHTKTRNLITALGEIPDFERFQFHFRESADGNASAFTLDDYLSPYSQSEPEFAHRVELEFWRGVFLRFENNLGELVGHGEWLITEISRFLNERKSYIRRCRAHHKKFARPAVEKASGDLHFRWLVAYQVLGKSFDSIAEAHNRSRSSVVEAVRHTAGLLGLTLRTRRRTGRPPGIKEKQKRHIAGN